MTKHLVPWWARLWIRIFPGKPSARPAPRPVAAAPPAREPARPVGEKVVLRDQVDGPDRRFLDAWIDQYGDLHIDGQDLGPATAPVSSDGEYEWFKTIAAADVPRVVEILGGEPGQDVMALLAERWAGRGDEVETRLRTSGIKVEVHVWSG